MRLFPRSWSVRAWPLRRQARLGALVLTALLTAAVAEGWVHHATAQLRDEAGMHLLQTARDMSDRLSREMANRVRDVQLLAQLDLFRESIDPPAMREALERLRDTLPAYAWIGVTDAQGQVVAATDEVLVGQSIAERPVFRNGRIQPWTGDVHEAVLLAKLAPRSANGEPAKFVDAAAPIRGADGSPRGVLALHLSWQWAGELRDAVLKPRGAHPSQQLMIFGADGRLLLAPTDAAGASLSPVQLAGLEEHWHVETWGDGVQAISAAAESHGSGEFGGFGWRVVVRDTAAMPPAEIEALRRDAWAWCGALGVFIAALAWWMIGVLLRPMDKLVRTLTTGETSRAGGFDSRPHTTWRTTSPPGTAVYPSNPRIARIERRSDVQKISAAVARLQTSLRERENTVRSLEDKAHHDALTGLYNRAFLAEFESRLARGSDGPAMEFAVLCMDLDHFKPINDKHGHAAGDQVLAQVATRLTQAAREGDFAFRLGGDEFMLLLPCPPGEGTLLARTVAARVLNDLRRPMAYLTLTGLKVGGSVGAATWRPGERPLAEAMADADEALYAAKRAGRGQFRQSAPRPQPATV